MSPSKSVRCLIVLSGFMTETLCLLNADALWNFQSLYSVFFLRVFLFKLFRHHNRVAQLDSRHHVKNDRHEKAEEVRKENVIFKVLANRLELE